MPRLLSRLRFLLLGLGLLLLAGCLSLSSRAAATPEQPPALPPEDAAYFTDLGSQRLAENDFEAALQAFDRALALDPDYGPAYFARGELHYQKEDYEQAVADYSRAVEAGKDDSYTLASRGEALRMLARHQEALADLGQAIELEPGDSFAYASRGQTYRELGELELALEDLDKALEIQPDYPWAADRRAEVLEEMRVQEPVEEPGPERGPLPLLAVMDFQVENLPASDGRLIVDLLSSALVSTRAYRVLERGRREAILSELEFSLQSCGDERCQLEAGRLLAADTIVVGSLGKVGSRYLLNAKLLKVETGEVLSTAYKIYPSLEDLVDGCEDIAFVLASS